MSDLGELTVTRKTGEERFKNGSGDLGVTLTDFWSWSASDIVSNTTRGVLAEFIVASALELDIKNTIRKEWDAFDLQIPGIATIEVKSCAYLQSWAQAGYSKISFSIKTSRQWDSTTNLWSNEIQRQADIYVFCFLNFRGEKSEVNPLNMDQWEFYALPTKVLNSHFPASGSISLNALRNLTSAVNYSDLKKRVLDCAS